MPCCATKGDVECYYTVKPQEKKYFIQHSEVSKIAVVFYSKG